MHRLTTFCFDSSNHRFETKTTEKALGPNDVLIRTTHSGLCTTDVHAKSKGCGLGHEGVGTVQEVGVAVKHMQAGDRVGWGWLHSVGTSMTHTLRSEGEKARLTDHQSCGHCTTCVTGYRQYCSEARGFAFSDLDQGAFSDYRIIDSAFAYLISDSISSVHAGPLMCAGASTYEALDAAGTGPNDRVGVVGIGGLGHMAVLFAKAMGCAVTAISSNDKKLEDAFQLGTDEFRVSSDINRAYTGPGKEQSSRHEPQPMNINVLLICSNEVPDLERLMPLLARRAPIVLMTIQQSPLTIPYMPFVLPGHRLIASTEASRENHLKMLEFAARHQIKPWTEQFPMTADGLAKAFERLESGQMRYRGVLMREQ